jgi:hypothetical protein
MAEKKHKHPEYADRILKALPAKLKAEAEVVAGGGAYSILKVCGKSVASVRDKNVRIVHPTDGSADSLKALAALIAEAAPEKKAEPKPKAKSDKGSKAKGEEKEEAKGTEGKGDDEGKGGDAK